MKILIATPELAGVAPGGGIAEYVFGLATSLVKRGHDVRVALPAYAYLRARAGLHVITERLVVPLGVGASEVTTISELPAPSGRDRVALPVILVGDHKHFATVQAHGQIYQWPNHEPWIAFSRAIVEFLSSSAWRPDVVHCQDAHTALVPVYLRQLRNEDRYAFASSVVTVLTIHNLLNQGVGPPDILPYAGLARDLFSVEMFEYYGAANCLKAGALSADRTNTVSRTYAREICESSDFGFGLEGVLRSLRDVGKLTGIVNGIDEDRWRLEDVEYDSSDAPGSIATEKRSRRRELYAQWHWEETGEPVISFRGRWDRQKGVELIGESLDRLLNRAKVVIGTWGTPGATSGLRRCWETLNAMAAKRPDRLRINPDGIAAVDETAAHYIISDFLLMPSTYEPCGLTQMECQRYGTLPIVRRTGGLADTVFGEVTPGVPSPNGFLFGQYDAGAMMAAVDRAIRAFQNPEELRQLVQNALRQQNGWDTRVRDYEALYELRAAARRGPEVAGAA
jgi:starch synthase